MRVIMLWGDFGDSSLSTVRDALEARGQRHILAIDQNQLEDVEVELSVSSRVSGCVTVAGKRHDMADVVGIYLRPYISPPADDAKSVYLYRLNEALIGWCEISPALVINRISAMASNTSKPYQANIIKRHGFEIPDTLITTSPRAVEEFRQLHGEVIYKSISGVRSIVSRLSPQKTQKLGDVVWAPTQFQQHVAGRDIRVHVIGERVICSEILSDADDYRYAGRGGFDLEIRSCEIPHDRTSQCVRLARTLGLVVAGIDLRVTPDGDWYCFEVNPSPGYSFYQSHSGQDIAGAIAELLMMGRGDGQRPVTRGLEIADPSMPDFDPVFPGLATGLSTGPGLRAQIPASNIDLGNSVYHGEKLTGNDRSSGSELMSEGGG